MGLQMIEDEGYLIGIRISYIDFPYMAKSIFVVPSLLKLFNILGASSFVRM